MIRRAGDADAAAISRLMGESVSEPWSVAALSYALTNPMNDFLVFDEGGVIGFICVENVIDEGCLSMIVVDKAHRRKGIATRLIGEALDISKMRSVYLEVNENNAAAIALYEGFGFQKITVRKKYYGEDGAIIMRKEL